MAKRKARKLSARSQINLLKKALKKQGISPDRVDLEGLVDSTLTYRENKENVMRIVMGGSEQRHSHRQYERMYDESLVDDCRGGDVDACFTCIDEGINLSRDDLRTMAENVHFSRKTRGMVQDNARKAHKVYPLSLWGAVRWARRPNRADLVGVDAPKGAKANTKPRPVRRRASKAPVLTGFTPVAPMWGSRASKRWRINIPKIIPKIRM